MEDWTNFLEFKGNISFVFILLVVPKTYELILKCNWEEYGTCSVGSWIVFIYAETADQSVVVMVI